MKERTLNIIIIVVSLIVPALVAALFKLQLGLANHANLTFFPKFHATLNGLTAICLMFGVFFIKQKKVKQHRFAMFTAFLLSSIFLISYVTYHSLAESTHYPVDAPFRTIYLIILLSHIVLAALILPLILFTFSKAINNKIEQHRKLAKWTFPLWLYVALTGVTVYLFMAPYYG
jgi:putative membrane protein